MQSLPMLNPTRRRFIRRLTSMATLLPRALASGETSGQEPTTTLWDRMDCVKTRQSIQPDSVRPDVRIERALTVRQQCALSQSRRPLPIHRDNGDEKLLAFRSG